VHDPEEGDEHERERDRKRDYPALERFGHGGTISRSHWCVRESVKLSLRRAWFDSSAAKKPTAETAKVASLFSLMTRNARALGPMIPAMEHRFFGTLTIAVVAGVTLLIVLLGLHQMLLLLLIAIYGD
jgi:hypothetical protein